MMMLIGLRDDRTVMTPKLHSLPVTRREEEKEESRRCQSRLLGFEWYSTGEGEFFIFLLFLFNFMWLL